MIGTVFEQKSRIGRTTRSVCIAENGSSLTLHVNNNSTVEAEVTDLTRTELTAAQGSIAGRLYRAAELVDQGTVKAKWDKQALTDFAWKIGTSEPGPMRALFDDCIAGQWVEIADSLMLSNSEKAWRRAHFSAAAGHINEVAFHLQDLPDDGYPTRVQLLLPFLSSILQTDRADWAELLRRWSPSIPARDLLLAVVEDGPIELEDCQSFAEELRPVLPDSLASDWIDAIGGIAVSNPAAPPGAFMPRWEAYHWLANGDAAQPGPATLAELPLALLDDAIESERLIKASEVAGADAEQAVYLKARLEPQSLQIEELRSIGHDAELARRLFLNKGTTGMAGLSDENPKVGHYSALLRLVSNGELDEEALIGEEHEALVEASSQRGLVEAGEISEVSDTVAADPSLWAIFSDLALRGRLQASSIQRLSFPAYAEWLDLHRVLELVWSGELRDAAELGGRLSTQLKDETLRDEALNLQAYALAMLKEPERALVCLEDAMDGEYTQALLINTGIVATEAEPAIATKYLNRLILEAPTLELQVGAMDRAVQLWLETPDLELHPDTAHCLYHLVLEPSLEPSYYTSFLRLAANADGARIANDTPPRPNDRAKLAAWEIFTTMAKARHSDTTYVDYVGQVIETSQAYPDEPWIDVHREKEIEFIRNGLFEDLGEPIAVVMAADKFLTEGMQFLARPTYFLFSVRTGLHLAARFQAQQGGLADDAARRLFFVPAEEFSVEKADMPEELAKILDHEFNWVLSLYAVIKMDEFMPERNALNDRYNSLAARHHWDSENRRAIVYDMNGILGRNQEMIDDVRRIADRVPRFKRTEAETSDRPLIDGVNDDLRAWQAEIVRLRSNL